MPNANELRISAHQMIASWNEGAVCQLIRSGVARDVTAGITDYSWKDRQTIAVDNAVVIRVSCVPSDPEPDEKLDIVTFTPAGGTTQFYKIVQKPRGPRPGNVPIFYDLDCLTISADNIS